MEVGSDPVHARAATPHLRGRRATRNADEPCRSPAALFLGLLILRIFQFIGNPLLAMWRALRLNASLKSAASTLAAAAMTLVIPALAFADWQLRIRFFQPPPPAHNPQIPLLGQSGVRYAKIGAITRYLIDHANEVVSLLREHGGHE